MTDPSVVNFSFNTLPQRVLQNLLDGTWCGSFELWLIYFSTFTDPPYLPNFRKWNVNLGWVYSRFVYVILPTYVMECAVVQVQVIRVRLFDQKLQLHVSKRPENTYRSWFIGYFDYTHRQQNAVKLKKQLAIVVWDWNFAINILNGLSFFPLCVRNLFDIVPRGFRLHSASKMAGSLIKIL